MTTRHATPIARATVLVSPVATPVTNERVRSTTLSPVVAEPEQRGSWLTMTMSAMPLR